MAGLKLLHEIRKAHAHIIYDMAWSPDSQFLVTGSADKSCRIFRLSDGKRTHEIKPQGGIVYSVAWSPDNTRLAIGVDAGSVVIADCDKFKIQCQLDQYENHGAGVTVVWSPDNNSVIAGCQSGHICWLSDKVAVPYEPLKPHTDFVGSLSLSHDGRYLASCSQQTSVCVYEKKMAGWEKIRTYKSKRKRFYSVKWSPTELVLATGNEQGTLALWTLDLDEPVVEATVHSHALFSITFSGDGKWLATKSWDDTIRIWKRDPLSVVASQPEPSDAYPTSIAFSPAGNLLATLGAKDRNVRIWEYDASVFDLVKDVAPPVMPAAAPSSVNKCDVLVLRANPDDTEPIDLDAEVRMLEAELKRGSYGAPWKVKEHASTEATELSSILLALRPSIVHFAGHGTSAGGIVLSDSEGKKIEATPDTLSKIFHAIEGDVECVVLNSCYSANQIDAILPYVKCVIGMSDRIEDGAALAFAEGFYRGIGFKKSYYDSFELGIAQMELSRFGDSAHIPRFESLDPAAPDAQPQQAVVYRGAEVAAPREPAPKVNKNLSFPVWFGTNRRKAAAGKIPFTNEVDSHVHFGTCRVFIPSSHQLGGIEGSWWERIFPREDSRLKVLWDETVLFESEDAYWKDVAAALAAAATSKIAEAAEKRIAFVFVHGFCVTFEQAAIRAAQLSSDLQLPGITGFFSWPSQGHVRNYATDAVMMEASEHALEEFLVGFIQKSGAERVHLLAHSMGNRGVLRVLSRLKLRGGFSKCLGQLILAAPDVARFTFEFQAPDAADIAKQTTMYICNKDRALGASRNLIYGVDRAGLQPPVTVVNGIDTVDASRLNLELLGHSYYGDAFPVLNDIRQAIIYSAPPSVRMPLKQSAGPPPYWYFPKLR